MIKIKCPKCKIKVIKIPIFDEEKNKSYLYIHPKTVNDDCIYKSDGIEVYLEDKIMQNAFIGVIKQEEEKKIIKKIIRFILGFF